MKKTAALLAGILLVGSMAVAADAAPTSAYAWGRVEYGASLFNTTSNTKEDAGNKAAAPAADATQILKLTNDPVVGNSDNWRGFLGFSTKAWDMDLNVNAYKIWDNDGGRTDVSLTKKISEKLTAKLDTVFVKTTLNNTDDFFSTAINNSTLTLTASQDGFEGSITYAPTSKGVYTWNTNEGPWSYAQKAGGVVGGYLKGKIANWTVVARPFGGYTNPTALNITIGDEFWAAPGTTDGWRNFNGIELYGPLAGINLDAAVHANLGNTTVTKTLKSDGAVDVTTTAMGSITDVNTVTYGSNVLAKIGANTKLGDIGIIANVVYAIEGANVESKATAATTKGNAGRNLLMVDGRASAKFAPISVKGEVQLVNESKSAKTEAVTTSERTYAKTDLMIMGKAELDIDIAKVYGKVINKTNNESDKTVAASVTNTATDKSSNYLELKAGLVAKAGLVELELNGGTKISSAEDKIGGTGSTEAAKKSLKTGSTNMFVGAYASVSF